MLVGQMVFRGLLLFTAVLGASLLLGGVVVGLAVALYMALLPVLPPPAALLAACSVPLAAGITVLVSVPRAMRSCAPSPAQGASEDILAELGNLAGVRVATLLGAHPRKTAMASLLAGFAVGASPELRRTLRSVLSR
jgi:hypothetical protein